MTTEPAASSVDREARLAALQGRSAASRSRPVAPAQISKIITTGVAASLTLGLVAAMGWSSAVASDDGTDPAAPPTPTVPPAAGVVVPSTVAPTLPSVAPETVPADAPATTGLAVVVSQPAPPPSIAPVPAPAPVVIDVAVPVPPPVAAAPSGGGSSSGTSNGSTKQSK